ncbi:MAG: hypothetical protein EHM40_06155 [Chloroflexi bacterium]|nr:MAG: hypothetical protein EHM40_06155 [Chloroflexota bacterium]
MSKKFIAVLLPVFLASACNMQVTAVASPANAEATPGIQPAASTTATPLFNTIAVNTATPSIVTATVEAFCPTAPHVEIGQQVTVLVEDWDKLKLRSGPEISSDTVLMELDQYAQLKILEGPVCVYSPETGDSYWFWKVTVVYGEGTGWVAEGDYSHYFIGAN